MQTFVRKHRLRFEEYRAAAILLAPAIIGLFVFALFPVFEAFRMSFYDAPLLSPRREFVGLENYNDILMDTVFHTAIVNTIVYAIAVVVLQVVLALVLAMLIKDKFPGVGFFRTAYIIPIVTSLVVVSTVWKIMFHTDNGLINSVLQMFSIAPVRWLTDPNVSLFSIVIIGVWKEVGFSMLVLLGGIQSIPGDLYEAASIDGASDWKTFWRITLPLLRRALLFVVVLSTVNAFKIFIPIYVITSGGPSDSTQTIVHYIYETVFRYFKLGYGSALSFVLLAIVLALTAGQFILLRSDVEY
ncbi:MAG: sugar ABC transporter permease [Chloroflexi bacterium]|nr:sugar ABC transporter permease [Chloroflexota bacterium]